MKLRHFCSFAMVLLSSGTAVSAELTADTVDRALQAKVGEFVDLPLPETPAALVSTPVKMRRIDVVAPGAKTYVVDAAGMHEVPVSDRHHFIADASVSGAPRYALSISADGNDVQGVLFGGDDRYAVRGERDGDGLALVATPRPKTDADGNPIYFACELDAHAGLDLSKDLGLPSRDEFHAVLDAAGIPKATTAASRTAAVAIDTDTELLSLKFSGNTTNATNYLDQLFLGMNTIYERDVDVTLQRGTTLLRTASDPYSTTSSSSTIDQLDEFGEEWFANQSAVNRAFAAQISGKSGSNFSSAGIAWLIGASNMCTQKGSTFSSGICTDGQCTSGHYSVSRVFKFAGADGFDDVLVVAHELGHNFGINHTHCTNASTGAQPTGSGTIDQCYNGESGSGCYSGTATCPTAQTINGVTNVRGTLMSYCHITPASCGSSEVFHPRNVTNLTATAAANVTSGCFTTGGAPGTFTIGNASITEGNSGTQTLNFVVTRTGGTGSGSVTATTSDGTATATGAAPISDYVTKTQVLTFAAAGTQNFAVTINGDTRDEDNETFTVTLSAPSAGFSLGAPSSATGTITDNDNAPTVSINSPAAVTEGATITFTVSLSAASGKAISVAHTTASGGGASGATEGSDFSDATGTLNFAADETSKTFNVSTTNDTLDEADTETFTATLSAPTNATLGTSSGTGSLNDNDALPSIAIADTSVTEGGNLQFTVTLTPVSGRTVTVPFSTADGTATVANNDYLQTSSSIQITAGNTTGQIIINTVSDAVDEADETMTVNLGSPTNATVSDGSATGTILDDDITAAAVSIADASLTEGNAGSANMVFTVSIPAAAAQATSVTYSTSPIDASAGSDYTAVTGTATITAGNTSTSIGVPIIGDTVDEWDEQFTVNLAATASSTLADGQAVGTIVDDDSGGDPVYRNGFE